MKYKNLKIYRTSLGLKTQDLADFLNMSKSAYYALEQGTSKLDMERALKLSNFYKIKLEDLIITNDLETDVGTNNNPSGSIEILKEDMNELKNSLNLIKNKLKI